MAHGSLTASDASAPQGEVNEAFLEALGVLGQKLDFLSSSALAQVRRVHSRARSGAGCGTRAHLDRISGPGNSCRWRCR